MEKFASVVDGKWEIAIGDAKYSQLQAGCASAYEAALGKAQIMDGLRPCPFCGAELTAGRNDQHQPLMRHPHCHCLLSEAQWLDTPKFREQWNHRLRERWDEPLAAIQMVRELQRKLEREGRQCSAKAIH